MKTPRFTMEVLLENKKEYLQHLYQLLTEPIYAEIQVLYQSVQSRVASDKVLEGFQEMLTRVPHWNADQVSALKDRIYIRMNCEYFQDLVKATIMVYLKLHLATLADSKQVPTLKVKIPAMDTIIHRVLVATARYLWKKPYLMFHKVRTIERQQNLLQCESYIHKAIQQTLQGVLPLPEIFSHLSKETTVGSVPPGNTGSPAASEEATEEADEAESESEEEETESASEETEDGEAEEEETESASEEYENSEAEEEDAESESENNQESEAEEEETESSSEETEAGEAEEDETDIMPQPKETTPEPVMEVKAEHKTVEPQDEIEADNVASEEPEESFNLVKKIEVEEIHRPQRKLHKPSVRKTHIEPNVVKVSKNAFF
jgi:DNA polymerase III gamma/tau subunit